MREIKLKIELEEEEKEETILAFQTKYSYVCNKKKFKKL